MRVKNSLLALPQDRHTSYFEFYKVVLNVFYGRCKVERGEEEMPSLS